MITFNNKVITINNDWLKYDTTPVDPYNPLGLPPFTLRLKYENGVTPTFRKGTAVQVSSSPNVWDLTYENSDWSQLLRSQNRILEVLGANTSGVTNMSDLFTQCSSLTSVPLFDTSNVTDMSRMFFYCSKLTSVPLFDTSKVTSMSNMFSCCTSLTSVPLFDTSNVTDMSRMFDECSKLTSVPLFNTSNVTDMNNMFFDCTSLTSVPLFDTSNVTDMAGMFYECPKLTSVPLFDTSKVTITQYMFFDCRNVQNGALALYQQVSNQTNPPKNHYGTFKNCGSNTTTGAAELAQIPSDWK